MLARPDDNIELLAQAVSRLAAAIEQQAAGLGHAAEPRYSRPTTTDLVSEAEMAAHIGISARTLARYRRQGRFASCWLRNGKHVRWRVPETLAAWQRGIC